MVGLGDRLRLDCPYGHILAPYGPPPRADALDYGGKAKEEASAASSESFRGCCRPSGDGPRPSSHEWATLCSDPHGADPVDDKLVGVTRRHLKRRIIGRPRDRPKPSDGSALSSVSMPNCSAPRFILRDIALPPVRSSGVPVMEHSSCGVGKAVSATNSHQGSWMTNFGMLYASQQKTVETG